MGVDLLNKHQIKMDFGFNGIIKKEEVIPYSNLRPCETILSIFLAPTEEPAEGPLGEDKNRTERTPEDTF